LHHRGKRLAGTAFEFTAVNSVGKIAKTLQFPAVKFPDIFAVLDNRLSLFSPQELMQYFALFSGVDHFAVEQGLILGNKFLLSGKGLEQLQRPGIHGFGSP